MFESFTESKPTLPLSSSDITSSSVLPIADNSIDPHRNRRETKISPLQSGSDTESQTANASEINRSAIVKDNNVQQQPRESGDGASSVGNDIEATTTTIDGRRVLSTTRNGSLFDNDDDDDADDDGDDTEINLSSQNSTVPSLQGIATAAIAATTATTTNSNSKRSTTSTAE